MNMTIKIISISIFLLFSPYVLSKTRIDLIPMYGGMDRSKHEKLKEADEKLIRDTTKHYGSREKASKAFVNAAFNYYNQNDNERAIARFNQAWVINPENPQVSHYLDIIFLCPYRKIHSLT